MTSWRRRLPHRPLPIRSRTISRLAAAAPRRVYGSVHVRRRIGAASRADGRALCGQEARAELRIGGGAAAAEVSGDAAGGDRETGAEIHGENFSDVPDARGGDSLDP